MTTIDHHSAIPIYHQLEMLIREQIRSGLWRPGDRIPTEKELCQMYGISRSPVRQALQKLGDEGVLLRRPGVGTFVSEHNSHGSPTLSAAASIQTMILEVSHWAGVLQQLSQVWNDDPSRQQVDFRVQVVSHSDFYERLSTAVGSGLAPDIAMVDCIWVAGLARSRFLYALEDLSSDWNHSNLVQDLYPEYVAANCYDGRLYGLPLTEDVSLLWYRKDWFAQEGLAPPRDWDELLQAARHFVQPRVKERYGLAYPLAFPGGTAGGEATVYNLLPFVWSAGADIFDEQGVVLDAPGTRSALSYLRDLAQVHRVCPPEVVRHKWDTTRRLFAGGRVAMALGGSYEAHTIRELSGWPMEEFLQRVGCVSPPAAPGREPVATLGGTSCVILRQCQRPALVMDVLKLATDPAVVGQLYRSMLLASPSPSFNSAPWNDQELLATCICQMTSCGRARPSVPDYVKISRHLQAMFESAMATLNPLEEIVRRTAESIGVISERPCRTSDAQPWQGKQATPQPPISAPLSSSLGRRE